MARIPVMMEEERGQEGPAELLGITPNKCTRRWPLLDHGDTEFTEQPTTSLSSP